MHRLLLLTLALALPAQAADPRMAIKLSADEVGTVNGQMRAMLNGVGQIVAGVAANDMKVVAAAARGLGMSGNTHVPMSLRVKLPAEFKSMGHPMHVAFDDMARDAESLGDGNHALKQLGDIMVTCNTCHETFRLVAKR